jgi:secondary thiamine-phosphate synthase enzyme
MADCTSPQIDSESSAMNPLRLQTLTVDTSARNEMLDVTERLRQVVRSQNILEGMLIAYVPHTTAAITINENADPDVKSDLLAKLSALVPQREAYYQHAEGNSDSHLKAAMLGHSVMVLVEGGKLVLGRWQGVYFCEFDGPRRRELIVKPVSFRSSVGEG